MSQRLPSSQALDLMSEIDRFRVLQLFADQAREEREGILSGLYPPTAGHTRGSILKANRRRLARIYARADEYDVGVGQPV